MEGLKNTCKAVNDKSWKIFLDKNSRKMKKVCDFENKDFVNELNELAGRVILDVRNGVEKDPVFVKKVRDAGYINEAFDYSRNLAKFAGDIFYEKIYECGSYYSHERIKNPDPEYRTKVLSFLPRDNMEDFDVCIDANVVFQSNEEYEKYACNYSVNTRTLPLAEMHMEQIIKKFRFDIIKKVYLHPGDIVSEF